MVQFGLRQNMLNETSTTVDGNKNVMNEAHTVVIDDFHSGTNFTTSTLARNEYGSEQSSQSRDIHDITKQQEDLNCYSRW